MKKFKQMTDIIKLFYSTFIDNKFIILFSIISVFIISCGADGNHPGYQYMPDMYESPSYETNSSNPVFKNNSTSQYLPKNSIPRGFVPFDFDNTLDDYLRAGKILVNPISNSEAVLSEGKQLFEMFCAHCHGKEGNGKGSINHPVYSAVPSYSDSITPRRSGEPMNKLKSGHIFHSLHYGLNAMGPHASQLSQEERWKIVHYVHKLQKNTND